LAARSPKPRIAVIGLGVGSVAAYAQAGWSVTFYEIDPTVLWAAEHSGRFSFLAAARGRGADVRVKLGDARLTLADAPDGSYDLIILDAFSGDAVPVHLLTREAIATYVSKLAPRGTLAVHTSNLYVNIPPVLAAAANEARLAMLMRDDSEPTPQEEAAGKCPSQWVALARDAHDLSPLLQTSRWSHFTSAPSRLWTDDYSDVIGVMRWHR
jgi:spermidine synthase